MQIVPLVTSTVPVGVVVVLGSSRFALIGWLLQTTVRAGARVLWHGVVQQCLVVRLWRHHGQEGSAVGSGGGAQRSSLGGIGQGQAEGRRGASREAWLVKTLGVRLAVGSCTNISSGSCSFGWKSLVRAIRLRELGSSGGAGHVSRSSVRHWGHWKHGGILKSCRTRQHSARVEVTVVDVEGQSLLWGAVSGLLLGGLAGRLGFHAVHLLVVCGRPCEWSSTQGSRLVSSSSNC